MWRRCIAVAMALSTACAIDAVAQTGTLAGVIVSNETGEPLPYAIVALPTLDRERFANDSGVFVFGELPLGQLLIRVRRLGYAPAEILFDVRAGASDTLRVQLSRVALRLQSVTVRALPVCREPGEPRAGDDSTLAIIFNQLRMNAEQYRLLAGSYPFFYAMEAVRSTKLKKTGQVRIDTKEFLRIDSKPDWRYRPGGVLTRRQGMFYFRIPMLIDFADSAFVAFHCFHYGGVEGLNDIDLVRIDVVAAETISEPDVNGSIYLDPKNYQVRRTKLRLSRPLRQVREIIDFEVITDFQEVMPSIPVISHVWSTQTIDPKARRDYDTAYEEQRLAGFKFLGAMPGEEKKQPKP